MLNCSTITRGKYDADEVFCSERQEAKVWRVSWNVTGTVVRIFYKMSLFFTKCHQFFIKCHDFFMNSHQFFMKCHCLVPVSASISVLVFDISIGS